MLAIPSVATVNPHLPANLSERMIKNDFVWAATNRDRIIAEWSKRYDGKSEPKKK
ncbi:periplasmic protein [Bordetella pertussis]|nr:periplasmic protein [Bordetella pertussis]